jgi:hypothetical protein
MKKILWPLFLVLLFVGSAVAQTVTEPLLLYTNGQRERVAALQERVSRTGATMAERKAAWVVTNGSGDRVIAASTNQSAATLELTRKALEAQAADERARAAAAHIELVDGAAVARYGPHRVTFAANAKTAGAVDLRTRTGERLRSHVLGLCYLEPASGKSVMLAELVDRTGEVLPPNRVIYRDAFAGVTADLLYEYTVSSLEQNVVIRKRLPSSPEEFGLDPERTQLAVLTEFIESPEPRQTRRTINLKEQYAALGITADETLPDVTLSFGSMRIVKGKAFMLGGSGGEVPVGKAWELLPGTNGELRRFLIESVPYRLIKPQLDALSAAITPKSGKTLQASSVSQGLKELLLSCKGPGLATGKDSPTGSAGITSPPRREGMKLAQAGLKAAPGVVLDYVILDTSLTGGVWFEDELPPDAYPMGDNEWWFWTDYWWDGDGWGGATVTPYSGSSMNVSDYVPGNYHQVYFSDAEEVIQPGSNDVLYAYVNLDSTYPPDEVMLQWRIVENGSESWEHRAYWGANSLDWGSNNTESRRPKGSLPMAGTWVRLEVPASEVGLVGKIIDGMAFTLYGGRAAWDQAGLGVECDTVWVEDSLPTGAYPLSDYESWTWMSSWYDGTGWGGATVTPYSGNSNHVSSYFPGYWHQHYFREATSVLQPGSNDVLYAYVNMDSTYPPDEVMLQWRIVENETESWEHRAYWGANQLDWGLDHTESRRPKGSLPTAGTWVRLEVPASEVGLVGKNIDGMAFTLYGGRAAWDRAGKLRSCADSDGDGLPDWWEMEHFGNLNQGASNDYDHDGFSNLQEYQNGTDPNTIHFSLSITNQYVSTSLTAAQIALLAGVPSSMAVLVDSTNVSGATWVNYNSSISLNLGSTQGWHEVRVGLRGRQTDSEQTWQRQRLKLDTTPPLLVITNPISSSVSQPRIQLLGYCPEALAYVTYHITNALGAESNKLALVLRQDFNTNTWEYTTNYFQCFDVPLTNGMNTVTLRATDLAGNVTTTNFSVTLDYSGKTNAPVIKMDWPRDGTRISGDTFTARGWLNDPTAQVFAQLVDTNGVTNIVSGRVGRAGDFWIKNVPLALGTNALVFVATDVVGNSRSTNINVIKSPITLTIAPATFGHGASGTISDTNYSVWVNGVRATNDSSGGWEASDVRLTLDNSVAQVRAIPNSDNGGSGSGGGGSDNPSSSQAVDTETAMEWPDGLIYANSLHWGDDDIFWNPGFTIADYWHYEINWEERSGGGDLEQWQNLPVAPHPTNMMQKIWEPGNWPETDEVRTLTWFDWDLYPYTVAGPFSATNAGPGFPYATGFNSGELEYGVDDRFWGIETVHYRDQTEVTLLTGGERGATELELYEISCSGWSIGPPGPPLYSHYQTFSNIPPEQISIGPLGNLDTNGLLFAALPPRARVNITPRASANYSSFTISGRKYTLISQCYTATPANRARTSIGVGEQVLIEFSPSLPVKATWTTTAGSLSTNYATGTMLTAPSNAANVTVTATIRGQSKSITFTVVEPAGIARAQITSTNHYSLGTAGAGMTVKAWVSPTNVSFYRVSIWEIGRVSTNATGYFANTNVWPAEYLDHGNYGANSWFPALGVDNSFVDNAYSGSCGSPWSTGSFTWPIPVVWQIGTAIPATNRPIAWNQDQEFSVNSSGTVTVRKFGLSITRTTNDVVTIP